MPARRTSFARGFSLIELLVVIILFSFTSFIVAASYLTFERNQRVKNAALTLKNEIRLAQNKALSGDKTADVSPPNGCLASQQLAGWYVELTQGQSSYNIGGDCLLVNLVTEIYFSRKTVALPNQITINSVTYNGAAISGNEANLFFRSVASDFRVYSSMNAPDFFDNTTGALRPALSPVGDLVVTLSTIGGTCPANCYKVRMKPSGEVNEEP